MKIAVTILMLVVTVDVSAQFISGAGATVNAGYLRTPALCSSMNSLAENSTRFSKGYTIIGIEGFYFQRKRVFLASAYMGSQGVQSPVNTRIQPYMWSANGGFGWIIAEKGNFQLYPGMAVGVRGFSLEWYNENSITPTREIRALAPSIDLSLTFNYIFTNQLPGNVKEGILVNVKIGYMRGMSDATWQLEGESQCVLSPRQLQGWQISVSTGGVGFFRYKR